MDDVAKIAKGLSEAQRCVLKREVRSEALGVQVWGHRLTMRVLDRLGLLGDDYRRGYAGWSSLTPLGLAVRQYLQENPNG